MTLRLFVADDSVTIQKIVSLAFGGEDVAIEAVSDGESALEKIRSFKPDVVLADVCMPVCNGYEVCARIKEDPELGHIPVILLVGTFEPFDEAEASRVRSDGFLTKPFDTSELTQTVHSLASRTAAPRGRESAAEPGAATTGAISKLSYSSTKGLVTPAAWESFLGEARVLELFDAGSLAAAETGSAASIAAGKPVSEAGLTEDAINKIVERVVRRMSPEVIREVAWEVVPELSESIIRRTVQAQQEGSKPV